MKNTNPSDLHKYKGIHIETNHNSSVEIAVCTPQAAQGYIRQTSEALETYPKIFIWSLFQMQLGYNWSLIK